MTGKKIETSLAELRKRHTTCVTMAMILHDVQQGLVPRYFDNPSKYQPSCDHPDDVICASPEVSTQRILDAIEQKRSEAADASDTPSL